VSCPNGFSRQTQWRIKTLKNASGDDLLAMSWRFFATQKTLFNISREGQVPLPLPMPAGAHGV